MASLGAQFKGTPVSELSGFILSLYALQLGTAHVAKQQCDQLQGLPVYSNKETKVILDQHTVQILNDFSFCLKKGTDKSMIEKNTR